MLNCDHCSRAAVQVGKYGSMQDHNKSSGELLKGGEAGDVEEESSHVNVCVCVYLCLQGRVACACW